MGICAVLSPGRPLHSASGLSETKCYCRYSTNKFTPKISSYPL